MTPAHRAQETWIRAILAGHVLVFLLVLLFRRNTAVLTGVFMTLGRQGRAGWGVAGITRAGTTTAVTRHIPGARHSNKSATTES